MKKFSSEGLNLYWSPISIIASDLSEVTLTFSLHDPSVQKSLLKVSRYSENLFKEIALELFISIVISLILLSVSLSSIFTEYSSNFIFSIDFTSTFGSSVTEIIYSKCLFSFKIKYIFE